MKLRVFFFALPILIFSSHTSAAQPDKRFFPSGCHQAGFEFANQKLSLFREAPNVAKSQDESLYLIFNKSDQEIILQTDVDSRYLPNYKKTIPPNHWAVFSRTENQLDFNCTTSPHFENDIGYTLDCYETVAVCNYNHAKFPEQNLGTYWLQKTSPDQRGMMHVAINKGILLRW